MQITRSGKKFRVVYEAFDLGLSKTAFQAGNYVAPGTFNINFDDEPSVLSVNRQLTDATASGLLAKLGRNILGSSNGILELGVNSSTIAVFSATDLSTTSDSATLIDADAGATAPMNGTAFVEWQDYAWFYDGDNALGKFGTISSGSGTITLDQATSLVDGSGVDILSTKTFLYWCNQNSVGRSSAHNAHNATALTLSTDERVQSLTQYAQWVIVGTSPKGNTRGPIKLYKWDGVSNNVDGQPVILPDSGLRLIRNVGGVVLIFCVSLGTNSSEERYFRVWRWEGGENCELIYELNLGATGSPTVANYYIRPANVDVFNNKAWFAFKANEANTFSGDNGVFSIDRTGRVRLEYTSTADTNDTSDLGFYFVRWIDNDLFAYHLNGSNERFSHFTQLSGDNIYSANSPIVLPAFRPDLLKKSRIETVRFGMKTLPASTSIALSIKTDQATSFTAVKTFNTTSMKLAKVVNQTEYTFQPGNIHQPKLLLVGSNSSKPAIILPITIDGIILNDSQ